MFCSWPNNRNGSNNLSSYDASYLDLAMRKDVPIATLDNRFIEAAKRIDVPIFTTHV